MFDFFGSTLSRTLANNGGDVVEGDEKPRNPFPHGPQRFRTVTNGQLRRAQARYAAAQKRKTNKRYRREWMRNGRAFVVLQQQLTVVGALPSNHYAEQDLVDNVERHLVEVYGSVEKALAYFEAVAIERAA